MLKACWLWFVILKKYVELTRPKIESRDPIFFIGTRARSRVSGNDRLFPRGSEFGPNLEIPASPVIQLRPRPENVELTRSKIESRDPIFFTGTRARSRVSGNDRLFSRGSEFGPKTEIPASPVMNSASASTCSALFRKMQKAQNSKPEIDVA